ncbi:MAG: RNA-directed DNA polymerase [Planctomycetaceae bacterium]|nr:RNA-directed DNA polymerase [Planctomycetaceae bacterium]
MKFKSAALDWALEHIIRHGDTDIFPRLFEFDAIKGHWKGGGGVREWMLSQDPLKWQSRPLRRCLAPKHRFGFRISTQLDPLDSIAYAALVYDLGKDIEKRRLPCDREIVHSYRFSPKPNGQLYHSDYGWKSFQKRSKSLAENPKCTHVVVADVADFFPKIYSHPLENELVACTARHKSAAKALLRMLKHWNSTISYGVPVGPAVSRLVSELALTIIDNALVGANAVYCRFSDDFRIFCHSQREAHERLAFLAQMLFEGLGLTLQQSKTRIQTSVEFSKTLVSPRQQERRRLSSQFDDIIDAIGLSDPYKKIDYESLNKVQKAMVDSLNLSQVLAEQIVLGEDLDIPVASFVLRRLSQLRDSSSFARVLERLDALYSVFPDAISYIASLEGIHGNTRRVIGAKLLSALDDTVSGHLEFHRCWVLSVFANSDKWDNEHVLGGLESKWSDIFTRRELIIARGRAGHDSWFKKEKLNFENMGPWERRAFLYAASCLPGDEPKHWWDGLKQGGKLDPVERAIVGYGKQHPIR